ncbi:MAG: DUF6544 family protein [Thermoleophilia bacterium]
MLLHGLLHLIGAARGFRWLDPPRLDLRIGTAEAAVWLAAAVLIVTTAVGMRAGGTWWWITGALGLAISQGLIIRAWADARAGTIANIILAVAVVYGLAAYGPWGFRTEYRDRVGASLTTLRSGPVLGLEDLRGLPAPIVRYVRRSGAVGKPRVSAFRAHFHGRIRASEGDAWMSYTGEQVNRYAPDGASRLFFMDATRAGMPVDVLHTFVAGEARMRVKLASLLPMVDTSGPEMTRSETVTLFNDLMLLCPGAIIAAPIEWQTLTDTHVRGVFTNGVHTVSADLYFDDQGDLVDFRSEDRSRSLDDDSLVRQPWSTPIGDHRVFDGWRVASRGEGRWHAPDPEGEFTYLEFNLDGIEYDPAGDGG